MAEIDPSILQRFNVLDNAPVLNMFQNALTSQKAREAQEVQTQRNQENLTKEQRLNRLGSLAQFSGTIAPDIQAGNLPAIREKVVNRLADLPKQGKPTAETRQILDLIDNPSIGADEALAQLNQFAQTTNKLATQFGVITPPGRAGGGAGPKSFAPIPVVKKDESGNVIDRQLVFPTVTDGVPELKQAQIPEGFELPTETPEEKRMAQLLMTRKAESEKVTGKGQAQRREADINDGIAAADGYANLVRAKDLLDSLETGGIDSVSLRAKQLFGVEGADEAELSNRMGKAVLSQLRTTFGAAFTAAEGKSLERIEANYGKSTAGNKRLIKQTMKLVEKVANRGIRSAVASEDYASAEEIKSALAFRLDVTEGNQTAGMPDLSQMSDDELRALAGQ